MRRRGYRATPRAAHDAHDCVVEQLEDLDRSGRRTPALRCRMLGSTIVVVNEDQQAMRGATSHWDDLRERVNQLEGELERYRENEQLVTKTRLSATSHAGHDSELEAALRSGIERQSETGANARGGPAPRSAVVSEPGERGTTVGSRVDLP